MKFAVAVGLLVAAVLLVLVVFARGGGSAVGVVDTKGKLVLPGAPPDGKVPPEGPRGVGNLTVAGMKNASCNGVYVWTGGTHGLWPLYTKYDRLAVISKESNTLECLDPVKHFVQGGYYEVARLNEVATYDPAVWKWKTAGEVRSLDQIKNIAGDTPT